MTMARGGKHQDGPCRDITNLFLKYRYDHKMKRSRFGYFLLGESQDVQSSYPLSGGPSRPGKEHLLGESVQEIELGEISHDSPVWSRAADQVKEAISQARDKISQLGKAEKRRLLRVVEDDSKYDAEIEMLSHSISQLIRQADRGIQDIGRMADQSVSGQEIILNVQKSLAMGLSDVSSELRRTQKEYMREVSRSVNSESSVKQILDAGFTDEQLLQMEDVESRVENRSIEISRIARSIHDLNSIFKDLGNLIVEQGTVLDRIDYNMENVVRDTNLANRELRKAEHIQKKSRVQKCIFVLVIFIFLNVVFLFLR